MAIDLGEITADSPAVPDGPRSVVWMFGRGLSSECGLNWSEPHEWRTGSNRDERIERIRRTLLAEMDKSSVDGTPIREFLTFLAETTDAECRHLFLTTNWDYLLQRELTTFLNGAPNPPWLHVEGSHVFHVNGTVEPETQHRSDFMLEDDKGATRVETIEANYAFNYLICERMFVVVGMSFECDTDRFLLRQISKIEDWMPIGEGHWIVVNPDPVALSRTCARIRKALPNAFVEPVLSEFGAWRRAGYLSLRARGVFRS